MALKKGFGKKFICASATLLLAASTLLGPACVSAQKKESKLADKEQMNIVAEALGCDLSYMRHNPQGGIVRMMHNDNEPIYVGIDDNLNEEENKLIKESLDYVFDIVGSINDDYRYEIVDNNKLKTKQVLGKTTIFYTEGDCAEFGEHYTNARGVINRKSNIHSKLYSDEYYTNFTIQYDRQSHEGDSYDEKLYTFLHELLHAFGLDDVYTEGYFKQTDSYHQNTIMNVHNAPSRIKNTKPIITPNDLNDLLAVYSKKYQGKELEEFKIKAKQVSDAYLDYFHQNRVDKIKNHWSDKTIMTDLSGQDLHSEFGIILIELDGSQKNRDYLLTINGDTYTLEISGTGIDGKFVTTGKVRECGGMKVLTNVRIPGNFDITDLDEHIDTIMDLYVTRLNGRDMLYDAALNDAWGEDLEMEKELI